MRTVETPWPDRCVVVEGPAPREWFSAEELAQLAELRLEKRREEWLLGRAAVKLLALERGLARDPGEIRAGRPSLLIGGVVTEWFLSLSHSGTYAGAILGSEPVGIDVQVVRDVPEAAAHLFLTDDEAAEMARCTIAQRMLHYWCAKEAAWKQEGGRVATLRQVPLRLVEQRADALVFDRAETRAIGELIVAVTATSGAEP